MFLSRTMSVWLFLKRNSRFRPMETSPERMVCSFLAFSETASATSVLGSVVSMASVFSATLALGPPGRPFMTVWMKCWVAFSYKSKAIWYRVRTS